MDKHEQIRRRLIEIAGNHGPLQTVLAKVNSVHESEMTCDLDDDGVLIYDVRLTPVITGNETIAIYPKVGSMALAVRIEDDDEWMLLSCEKADKYRITANDCIIEMDSSGIKISKGSESLKAILSDLITAIKALTVPTGTGPSGTPINSTAFTAISNRLTQLLK